MLHKIGVTGGDVKARISGAKKDPTQLLAVIEEAIRLLMDGTLHECRFDVESARIVKHASHET